jgi:hypothetical protein
MSVGQMPIFLMLIGLMSGDQIFIFQCLLVKCLPSTSLSTKYLCISNVCQLDVCLPNVCRPNVCLPNVCRPNVCRPNVCRPNVCHPNVCRPNVCRPPGFRQKVVKPIILLGRALRGPFPGLRGDVGVAGKPSLTSSRSSPFRQRTGPAESKEWCNDLAYRRSKSLCCPKIVEIVNALALQHLIEKNWKKWLFALKNILKA